MQAIISHIVEMWPVYLFTGGIYLVAGLFFYSIVKVGSDADRRAESSKHKLGSK